MSGRSRSESPLTPSGQRSAPSHRSGSAAHFEGFTAFLIALTVLLLFTGILIRLEGLQNRCTDWPFCLHPLPRDIRTWVALAHRLLAFLLVLFLLPWMLAIGLHRLLRQRMGIPALISLSVLITHAWLIRLDPMLPGPLATMHSLLALLFLFSLILAWSHCHRLVLHSGRMAPIPAAQIVQAGLAVLLLVQATTGSHLAQQEEGLACPEFPACYVQRVIDGDEARIESVIVPVGHSMQSAQQRAMNHRWLGIMMMLAALWLLHRTRRTAMAPWNALLAATLGLQILIGAFSVRWGLPMLGRLLHAATGMAAFALAVSNSLAWDFARPASRASHPGQ